MLTALLQKIIGSKNDRELKKLRPVVEAINRLEPAFARLSTEELRAKTEEFKRRIADATHDLRSQLAALRARLAENGSRADKGSEESDALQEEIEGVEKELREAEAEVLDVLLPEAFAAVREASRRTTGMRHFDCQLLGGIVLHQGKIAEMKTGEGKTLVATLPLYLNALLGRGAHLVTVNDYLARRDVQWMGPIYHALGLSVASIVHDASFLFDPTYMVKDYRYLHLRPISRKEAYAADITYGTNNEFGFDYLRDHMAQHPDFCFQRGLNYAIVDEIDSILIDEARTPLIISGPTEQNVDLYYAVDAAVRKLRGGSALDLPVKAEPPEDWDYVYDEKDHTAFLTEKGLGRVQKMLGLENMYAEENIDVVHYVNQALRAHTLYEKDVDYVVTDEGEVVIVDEFTGRLMPGRRWSDGLHQAVEAKENLRIQQETQTYATITLQNYFRLYDTLAGMTGTADTEAQEFNDIYSLDVVVVPTNRPCIRVDFPDLVFRSKREKFEAVVEDIAELRERGRPVLVGTISIEDSEYLSGLLKKRGIRHNVLNAKQHAREAEIVAQAGRSGQVTIATNMAGRGTDIILGGNPDLLARELLKDPATATEEEWQEARERAKRICAEDHEKVVSLGGLHVLGTERHEARRIDNQLRGRCARQGDPGSSQFYLSLEDELMRLFGGERIKTLATRLGMQEGEVIEHRWVTRSIRKAQKKVETRHFEARKHVLKYDDVMNTQRSIIYEMRDRLMAGEDPSAEMLGMMENVVDRLVDEYTGAGGRRGDVDRSGLLQQVARIFNLQAPPDVGDLTEPDELRQALTDQIRAIFDARLQAFGDPGYAIAVMRWVMLRRIDSKWKDHLLNMDHLREGLQWSSNDPRYVQGRPEIAYQQEGYRMFEEMYDALEMDIIGDFFHVEILSAEEREARQKAAEEERMRLQRALAARQRRGKGSAGERPHRVLEAQTQRRPVQRAVPKVGANAPCPCGSGKKYKVCCGRR